MGLFKPGQYVELDGKDYKVPDFDHYVRTKSEWNHFPFYKAMTTTVFGARKEKEAINRCIVCEYDDWNSDCKEYVLLELDQFGSPTGKIESHVCEKKLKLSRRFV